MTGPTFWTWVAALVSVAVVLAAATVGYRLPACAQEDGGPYPCVWDHPPGHRVVILTDD